MIAILRGLLIFFGFVLIFGLALKKNTPDNYQLLISKQMPVNSSEKQLQTRTLKTLPTATKTTRGWKWQRKQKNTEGTIVQETWEINDKTQTLSLTLQVDPTFYTVLFTESPINQNAMRQNGIVLFEKTWMELWQENDSTEINTED